jgi:hypothetical protein
MFTISELNLMNSSKLWDGTIKFQNNHSFCSSQKSCSLCKYTLYATECMDTSGRNYIAIPTNVEITDEIKETYKIL